MIQLDFFQEDDMSRLEGRMNKVEDSANRCRKSQFAKIGAIDSRVLSLEQRMEILERNICQGK